MGRFNVDLSKPPRPPRGVRREDAASVASLVKSEYEASEDAVAQLKSYRKKADEPFLKRMAALERERAKALADIDHDIKVAMARQEALRSKLQGLEAVSEIAQWAGRIPEADELKAWYYDYFANHVDRPHKLPGIATDAPILRIAQVPGLVLRGIVSTGKPYTGNKVYAAFDEKTHRVVGWLVIESAKHAGDWTQAAGEAWGVNVFPESGSNKAEPVTRWVAALRREPIPKED